MESYYFLPGGIESLIERTEHSLMEMEFFFKTTKNTNAQTRALAHQLLIILRGMSDESGN
jgi:glycyl-tRNA synthetase (class II)